MPTLLDDLKAILTGMSVTLKNALRKPVTVQYPWVMDDIPPNSRGMLRMVDFHDSTTIDHKADWYAGTRWAPCTMGCPAHTDARGYVTLAGEGRWREGLEMLRSTYPFVATLGRVCPAPCEKNCSRGFSGPEPIAIRKLKRVYSDWESQLPPQERFSYEQYCCSRELNGKSVGIIGGGPAGYQCAMLLRKFGFECHIYEMKDIPGGFLTLGIPKYRLPRHVVEEELQRIHSLNGIHLHLNTEVGHDVSLEELEERHEEVIIAAGAWEPYHLGLENEEKPWVWYGEDFLEEQLTGRLKINPQRVVVVGGGNTGFDCGRTCRRLGAECIMIYRRTRKEMPSEEEEIEDGEEEGIEIRWLTSPKRIVLENGKLKGLEVIKNRLGDKDRSGRRRPIPIEGSEYLIECDMIITALGRKVDIPWLPDDIKTTRWGTIRVDPDTGETTRKGVWACGDVINVATVIAAIGSADRCCLAIAEKHGIDTSGLPFLYPYGKLGEVTPYKDGTVPDKEHGVQKRLHTGLGWVDYPAPASFSDPTPWDKEPIEIPFRKMNLQVPLPKIPGPVRVKTFDEHDLGFTLDMARQEGRRCFGCSGEMCVGCGCCVDACPDACIRLKSETTAEGHDYPVIYSIDLARCCWCGLCTEACPTKSLVFTSNFEIAVEEKQNTYLTKERMDLGLVRKEKLEAGEEKVGAKVIAQIKGTTSSPQESPVG